MRRMLTVLGILIALLFCYSVGFAETLTFEWTQEDTTNLKEWKLFWSEVSGGPYTEIAVITYDSAAGGPIYNSSQDIVVTGDQATHVMKYFVLIACGDIPQSDGSTKYLCSEDSNEVSHDFWISAGQFSVPINFKIVVQ